MIRRLHSPILIPKASLSSSSVGLYLRNDASSNMKANDIQSTSTHMWGAGQAQGNEAPFDADAGVWGRH
jgi:hypothetical protein